MNKPNIPRVRCYLRRVKLDAGGYVRKGQDIYQGTYYGIGRPLYHLYAEWDDHEGKPFIFTHEFRADGRADAIERVKRDMVSSFPNPVRLVFSGKF